MPKVTADKNKEAIAFHPVDGVNRNVEPSFSSSAILTFLDCAKNTSVLIGNVFIWATGVSIFVLQIEVILILITPHIVAF